MQGHHLHCFPSLTQACKRRAAPMGAGSMGRGAGTGHWEVKEAGTSWGHRGAAPGWGNSSVKGCQGWLTARQGTGWILMLL